MQFEMNKLFLCEFCGKSISQIGSLKRHQRRKKCKSDNQQLTINKMKIPRKKRLNLIKMELCEQLIFKENFNVCQIQPRIIDTPTTEILFEVQSNKDFALDSMILNILDESDNLYRNIPVQVDNFDQPSLELPLDGVFLKFLLDEIPEYCDL